MVRPAGPADPGADADLESFARGADLDSRERSGLAHAVAERSTLGDDPYGRAVQGFAGRWLPARGWPEVLVLGAGVGDAALFLAERGYEVTLIDRDGPASRFARHRLERRGLAVELVPLDEGGEAIAGRFHAIFATGLLLELADPCGAARRLTAALHPRGLLFAAAMLDEESVSRHPCVSWRRLGLEPVEGLEADALTPLRRAPRVAALGRRLAVGLHLVR